MNVETQNTVDAARLVKNSIRLFTAETISKLIALGIQIVAARYLGDKGFGTFAFGFSLTGILMILVDSGINTYLIREISRDPEKIGDYLGNAFLLKGCLFATGVLILSIMQVATALDGDAQLVVWAIGLAMLINGYADTYMAVFRALENMSLVSLLMIIQRSLFFLSGLTLLLLNYKVVPLCLAFLVVACINLLICRWQMQRRHGKNPWQIDWPVAKTLFMQSLPIGGTILFTYIYFRIDTVMLFFMRGESETGWYSAAFKLVETMVILIAGIRNAIFPFLSRTYAAKKDRFVQIWKEASRFLLIVTLPLAGGIALLAPRMVETLYGPTFTGAGLALQVTILVLPLLCLNDIISYLLMSADKAKLVLRIVGAGAALNVVMNMIFIPRGGYMGAAVATCLTEVVLFLIYCQTVNRLWGKSGMLAQIGKPALGTLGMTLVMQGLFTLPLLALTVVGAFTYLALLLLFQTFTEYDFTVLRGVLNITPAQKTSGPVKASFLVPTRPRKILLIKLGAIGDLVMASSFFDRARKHFSSAEITLLTGKFSFSSIENNPCIDRFIRVDDTGLYHGNPFIRLRELARITLKLRKENFELAFVMHRAWPFNLLTFFCGIPCRVGFARGREGILLTHRVVPIPLRNEREHYLDLLRVLNISTVYEKSYYFVSQKEEKVGHRFLESLKNKEGESVIAVAPGGGKNVKLVMPNKRWPLENYVGLIRKISYETMSKIILLGSIDEKELISEIRKQCPECHDATSLTLGQVATLFRKCSLFIGNDSGPLHIASAMGVPTLSFYSPTNPRDWAPPEENATTLYKQVECSPCYNHGKFPECDHLNCLKSITVEEAWANASRYLVKVNEVVS